MKSNNSEHHGHMRKSTASPRVQAHASLCHTSSQSHVGTQHHQVVDSIVDSTTFLGPPSNRVPLAPAASGPARHRQGDEVITDCYNQPARKQDTDNKPSPSSVTPRTGRTCSRKQRHPARWSPPPAT